MPSSDNNLPSLEGQRYYTLVQERKHRTQMCSADSLHAQGMALSIIHSTDHTIMAKVQSYRYNVTSKNGRYYVTDLTSSYDVLYENTERYTLANILTYIRILRSTRLALYYSPQPTTRADSIHELLSVSDFKLTLGYDIQNDKNLIIKLLRSGTDINHIDEHHVQLLVNRFVPFSYNGVMALIPKPRGSLERYAQNTYVNIVYDCDTVCSQSVIGDAQYFMDYYEVRHYGLLCMQGILEHRNAKATNKTLFTASTDTMTDLQTNTVASVTSQYVSAEYAPCNTEACMLRILPMASVVFATCSLISVFAINTRVSSVIHACYEKIRSHIPGVDACIRALFATSRAMRRVAKNVRETRTEELRVISERRSGREQSTTHQTDVNNDVNDDLSLCDNDAQDGTNAVTVVDVETPIIHPFQSMEDVSSI